MTDASTDGDDDHQALLHLLLAEEGVVADGPGEAIGRAEDAPPSLSFAQERLWFVHQLNDGDSSLNMPVAVRLRGELDAEAIEGAVADVVERHATLRTSYQVVDGAPCPHLIDTPVGIWATDDLEGEHDPEMRLAEILAEEAARCFDLERDAPVHVRLVRLGAKEHVLALTLHHIAADGWSMRVLFEDLSAFYGARAGLAPSGLDELAVDYHDYAVWQRSYLGGPVHARQLDHWRATLAGPLPETELPPDFARPRRHTFEGGQVSHRLEGAAADAVRALARRGSATTFMVLLATLDVLIARRGDLEDVIVGTPVAGRIRPEVEPLVGAFLNMLALRVDLSGDPSFDELVHRVRDVALDAFDNQDIAFEHLLAELSPERDPSRTPLFQVLLNMTTSDDRGPGHVFADLEVEIVAQADLASKFDLTVYVDEQPEGPISLLFVYDRSLYRSDTMSQLLDQFVALLAAAAADPGRPISTYSLVTAEAESALPSTDAPLDATWHGSVVDAVWRHAATAPDSVAIESATEKVTYGQLAERVNGVSGFLLANAVGVGRLVVVHAHRSPDLVWTLLGVLACGASYLVLDPKYPPRRLAQLVRLARPTAWLSVPGAGAVPDELREVLDELGVEVRAEVGALAPDPDRADRADRAGVTVGPEDLACLTFTSGSTGVPKAVVGRHGSLSHFLPWQTEEFAISSADRFTMLSGLAHDPLQRDIFWPLWAGATLVVPDPDSVADPGWLARWMAGCGATVTHLTPALGRLLTDHAGPTTVPSLRHALFTGDVLTGDDVLRLRAVAPSVSVCNLYGTTETQRASGYHVVGDDDLHGRDGTVPRSVLPIGRGMADGSQVLVRGPDGRPAGFGEVGEVWMRSPHLSAGYLDQPELTADRFVAVDGRQADRAYRTGDRGRYRADGVVEFLGRRDEQVQLRGFRIETGEVRAALLAHPEVEDAAVVVRPGPPPRLVAYVVPTEREEPPDPGSLRTTVQTALPAPMVPSDFVVIERIPLSPAGKLDVAALPDPSTRREGGTTGGRDELEQRLAGWFAVVLDRDDVGIHDNFFDLGGYSLLATQLFATIEAETGRRIPVATLFEAPTVASLAQVLRGDGHRSKRTSVVAIQPEGTQVPFFYVAPYMIGVVELARLGDELGPDQPLFGIQPQGLDGRHPIHTTIEEMATHYISELRSIQPVGPYRLGGHCSGSWVAFEMARQLEASGDELDTVVLVDQGPPGVDHEMRAPWRYAWIRMRFYFRDKRLLHALRWQLKIWSKRRFLRRVAPRTIRYEEAVREAHRAAYREYVGGAVEQELVLVRSDESILLEDKGWHLEWASKTARGVRLAHTPGTHANLLKPGYVADLAARLRWAMNDDGPFPER